MLTALLGLALANEVVPWAAPWDVQDQYAAFRKGRGEPVVALACDELWADTARVCFRRVDEGRLVRLHEGEVSVPEVREAARESAATWVEAELETVPVEGMEHSYRMLRDASGKAVLGALDPRTLSAALGLPVLVALPSTSVLVAWKGGDPDLDKVMAVGVTELHAAAKDPVSPVVWGWDGERWFPFAEAKPK